MRGPISKRWIDIEELLKRSNGGLSLARAARQRQSSATGRAATNPDIQPSKIFATLRCRRIVSTRCATFPIGPMRGVVVLRPDRAHGAGKSGAFSPLAQIFET